MSKAYEKVNEIILASLERGEIPWVKPWSKCSVAPQNFATGHRYTGANFFLTSLMGGIQPYFLTFKQVQDLGGKVKAGSKALPVIYWNMFKKEGLDKDGQRTSDTIPFLKYYNVFKASDIEGIEFPAPKAVIAPDPIPACEHLVAAAKQAGKVAPIFHDELSAYYSPSSDQIHLPQSVYFNSMESYYSTLFHEMGHSTGHASRLGRKGVIDPVSFGSHTYSKEELIAELTAAYLCAHAGLDTTLENSAAYIQSWSKKLTENPKWFIEAAGQAQKAANFILLKEAQEIKEAA